MRKVFQIDVLSPIHVGDGNSYPAGSVVPGDTLTRLIDLERAMFFLSEEQARDKRWTGLKSLRGVVQLLGNLRVNLDDCCVHQWPSKLRLAGDLVDQPLRCHIRQGTGHPIIPGSSLKGALRTVLLKHWATPQMVNRAIDGLANMGKAPHPGRAANQLESTVFRGGSNWLHDDLLRVLAVRDAAFERSELRVGAVETFSPSQEVPQRKKNFVIGAEVLCPGATSQVEITIDDFLNEQDRPPHFKQRKLTWQLLLDACRRHFADLLRNEIEYAQRLGHSDYAEGMRQIMIRGLEEESAIPLRLGFGIGWRGMTGELVDAKGCDRLLSIYHGKMAPSVDAYHGSIRFPKTREVIYLLDETLAGHPFAMGFLMLREKQTASHVSLSDPVRLARQLGAVDPRPSESSQSSPTSGAPAPVEPQPLLNLRQLKVTDFAGRMPALVRDAQSLSESERAAFSRFALEVISKCEKGTRKKLGAKEWYQVLEVWAKGPGGADGGAEQGGK